MLTGTIVCLAICHEKISTVSSLFVSSEPVPVRMPVYDENELQSFVSNGVPDLFVLDYTNFIASGFDSIEYIRSIDSNVPIFVVANSTDIIDVCELYERGVCDLFFYHDLQRLYPAFMREMRTKAKHSTLRRPTVLTSASRRATSGSAYSTNELGLPESFDSNKNFLYSILDNIPAMIYVKDAKSLKYLYLNHVGETVTGFDKSDLLGKNVFELFPKDYAEFYNNKDNELLQSRKPLEISEEMVLTKDFKLKVFFTKKILVNDADGEPLYLIGISEDLTERLNTKQELRKSEMRFSKLFHSSPLAIFVVRKNDGVILDINNKFLEIVGDDSIEFIGKKPHEVDMIIGTKFEEMIQPENDKAKDLEFSFVNAKGEELVILLTAEEINFDKETWLMFMGIDITERKRAEAETSAALDKQVDLNSLKTQFISMISHEFRTPLTTIMLSTDLLKRYGDKWDYAEKSKHFQRIQDTILKMTHLMENVLIIGRIDSGKFQYNPEEIDLNEFAFSLAKNMEFSQTGSHKINLHFNGDDSKALVDTNLLALVLNNLLSNAIKYSPGAKSVDLTLNCNPGRTEFIISDHGIGIPDEQINLLFQSFFRANNVGTISGYGLGLSIVKKCVEAHKGHITVLSQQGKGTSFIVSIPT